MSKTIKFGTVGSVVIAGVVIKRSARLFTCGSAHRNISCGFTCKPAFDGGTKCEMNCGFVGFFKLKNLMSKGEVVSFVRGQACITELQRKFMVISNSALGQTRSSREVTPTGWPDVFSGAGISPTTVGLVGSLMLRIKMPGCTCGQASKPKFGSVLRGSPNPQRLEPSVRLPM